MLGGHIWELAIILGLALVVFGPKRLPEIGGALGKGIREFKHSTSEITESITASHEAQAPTPVQHPIAVVPQPTHTTAYETEGTPAPTPYSNAG